MLRGALCLGVWFLTACATAPQKTYVFSKNFPNQSKHQVAQALALRSLDLGFVFDNLDPQAPMRATMFTPQMQIYELLIKLIESKSGSRCLVGIQYNGRLLQDPEVYKVLLRGL